MIRGLARAGAKQRGRCYLVTAPYVWTDRILEDGSGPRYEELAVLFVRTTTKARAKVLAARAWRRSMKRRKVIGGGIPDAIADRENPFRGMKCERVELPDAWEPLLEAVA